MAEDVEVEVGGLVRVLVMLKTSGMTVVIWPEGETGTVMVY